MEHLRELNEHLRDNRHALPVTVMYQSATGREGKYKARKAQVNFQKLEKHQMTDLLLVCINLLILAAAWYFVFRTGLRRLVRDRLFDIREDLRAEFVTNHTTDHDVYIYLRDYVNHDIRYLQDFSILAGAIFQIRLTEEPELEEYIQSKYHQIEKDYPELKDRIEAYRKRANRWTKFYIIHSSPLMISLFYPILIYFVAINLLASISTRSKNQLRKTYTHRIDAYCSDETLESYPVIKESSNLAYGS